MKKKAVPYTAKKSTFYWYTVSQNILLVFRFPGVQRSSATELQTLHKKRFEAENVNHRKATPHSKFFSQLIKLPYQMK